MSKTKTKYPHLHLDVTGIGSYRRESQILYMAMCDKETFNFSVCPGERNFGRPKQNEGLEALESVHSKASLFYGRWEGRGVGGVSFGKPSLF